MRGRPTCLDLRGQLALTLQFLTSSMKQKTLCQLYGVVPSSVSKILSSVMPRLLLAVSRDPDARIRYPSPQEMAVFADWIHERHPDIPEGIFGFVDGVVMPCFNPPDPDIQNAYYNGYQGKTTITDVLIFQPDGCICYAAINYPGSYHDSRSAKAVYELVNDPVKTPDPFKLLGDSAFPSHTGKIVTVKKSNQLRDNDPLIQEQKELDNHLISSARQTVEWGMRGVQSVFGRLKEPLKGKDQRYNFILIRLCLQLFNSRTRRMGILNQIQTVFREDAM